MSPFPQTPITTLTGHTGIVHSVTYSSGNSTYILTGCSDRTIRLYNPQKAAPTSSSTSAAGLVTKYTAHGYEVLSLAINATNDKFISTGGDKTVFLWDVSSAQTLRRFGGHAGRVNRGVWGGDGDSVIVSASFDGTVKLWDAKSHANKPVMTLDDAKDSVTDVVVHDAEIVAASVDGRVRSYDIRMGSCVVDVVGPPVTSLAVSKKGTEVLVGSLDSKLRLMDRANGELLRAYTDQVFVNTELRVRSTLGLNDSVVLSGSEHGMVFVWDVMGGECLYKLSHVDRKEVTTRGTHPVAAASKPKQHVVSAVAFCQSRREWCSGGGDGNVVVWGMGAGGNGNDG
ncbi:mitogen-activated protein kinase organizer 1 [Decorospora gaudefroyi]|uniref:Mitogen-activated protein kinase organizer 1 n=1 Tax=Decorospora gaudefroyi TaxID=184978 RepID=A0A6A5KJV0_9PLEO|nr:mitogen-activated protein kinase organizer 1 [Decorospora gaudefroyi]